MTAPYLAGNQWGIGGRANSQDLPFVPYGRTDYVGVAGYAGFLGEPPPANDDFFRGVFWNRSKIDFRDITDGASHTLLFGEATGAPVTSYTWAGVGMLPTAWGLTDNPSWYQFGSFHPGIVNFCLADGSVRNLSTKIDYDTFVNLSSIADGERVEVP